MFEVIYTSTPRGIQQGSTGFTFAAYTKGMPPQMLRTVERYCRYEWQNSDPNCYQDNPVNWLHVTLLSGTHLLSRIGATRADSTGRSNYIADHFLLQETECRASGVGPVQAMQALKYHSSWDSEPKLLDAMPVPTPNPQERNSSGAFGLAGLDVNWPAFLANILTGPKGRPAYVVYSKEHEILRLLGDVFSWIPAERQWSIKFTTYATESSRDDCLLRCVPAETSYARTVLEAKAGNAYDLASAAPQIRVTPVSNPAITPTQQTASTATAFSGRPGRVKPLVRGAGEVEGGVALGAALPNPSGLVPQPKPSPGFVRYVPWSLFGCALVLLLVVVIYFQREMVESQHVKKELEERHNRQVDDLKSSIKDLQARKVELETANNRLRQQVTSPTNAVDERGDGSKRPGPKNENEAMASGGGGISPPPQPPADSTNAGGGGGSEQRMDKEQPRPQDRVSVMGGTDLPPASPQKEEVVALQATPVNLEEVLAGTTRGEKEITLLKIPEGAADYSEAWLRGLEAKSEIEHLKLELSTSGAFKTIKANGNLLCRVRWDKKKHAVTLIGQAEMLPLLQWITFESVKTDNIASPQVVVRLKELENSERKLRLRLVEGEKTGSMLGSDENEKALINRMCYLQKAMNAMRYQPNAFTLEFENSEKGEWKWHKDPKNPMRSSVRCTLPVESFHTETKNSWESNLKRLSECKTKLVPSDRFFQCGFEVKFDLEKKLVRVASIKLSETDERQFLPAVMQAAEGKVFSDEEQAWAYANDSFWKYLRGTSEEDKQNREAFKRLADGVSVSKVVMEFVKSEGDKKEPPVAVTLLE